MFKCILFFWIVSTRPGEIPASSQLLLCRSPSLPVFWSQKCWHTGSTEHGDCIGITKFKHTYQHLSTHHRPAWRTDWKLVCGTVWWGSLTWHYTGCGPWGLCSGENHESYWQKQVLLAYERRCNLVPARRCDQAGPRASTSNKEACDGGANSLEGNMLCSWPWHITEPQAHMQVCKFARYSILQIQCLFCQIQVVIPHYYVWQYMDLRHNTHDSNV